MSSQGSATPSFEEARRERRIKRTRQAILDAAARLFAEKGYEATTTKDIAAAVDVGESTLYGYFSSKQEVLQTILARQGETIDATVALLGQMKGRESFIEVVDLVIEHVLTRPVYTRVVLAEAWTSDDVLQTFVHTRWGPISAMLQEFISAQIATGHLPAIDPQLGARMIIGAFIAAILPRLRVDAPPLTPAERRALATAIVELIGGLKPR